MIWALCLNQELFKKVKGDRSYGVHKVRTVQMLTDGPTDRRTDAQDRQFNGRVGYTQPAKKYASVSLLYF